MAKIEHNDELLYGLNVKLVSEPPRGYSGLSTIGEPCARKLQYMHYWTITPLITKRLKRLFNVGHRAEDVMVMELAEQDIIVGSFQKEIIGFAGHWKGHVDGVGYHVQNPEDLFLTEFKTHNDKNFKALKKQGVEKAFPKHYDQMQAYMGYLKLPMALYLAENKNDSEYWYTWVEFDKVRFRELKGKECDVITSDVLLPRIGNDTPAWFECKMCEYANVCFGRKKPSVNCRTCKYVDVVNNGEWICSMTGICRTEEEQRIGCDKYEQSTFFDNA